MSNKVWAIIPAGGVGARMESDIPKQYLTLQGKAVIEQTLSRLCDTPSIDTVLVGIAGDDTKWAQLGFNHPKFKTTYNAGEKRVDTVENGLKKVIELGGEQDWALVHDAARPCVRIADMETLIRNVQDSSTPANGLADDGGILALPLSDTVKRANENGDTIDVTVPRASLWRAMTPQLFKVNDLLGAIEYAKAEYVDITDEASAMEAYGCQPLLVPSAPDNIKITVPQDIEFCEMILSTQALR